MDDRLHVLIAEDETIIRLDLKQLLEREGVVVSVRRVTGSKRSRSRARPSPTS